MGAGGVSWREGLDYRAYVFGGEKGQYVQRRTRCLTGVIFVDGGEKGQEALAEKKAVVSGKVVFSIGIFAEAVASRQQTGNEMERCVHNTLGRTESWILYYAVVLTHTCLPKARNLTASWRWSLFIGQPKLDTYVCMYVHTY